MTASTVLRYYIRVTTTYGLRRGLYRFNAMFVRREDHVNRVSAKSYATVEISESHINAEPRVGQIWELLGSPDIKITEHNGFESTQYAFADPIGKMILPETAEEFIQFVAKEPDFEGIGEVKARKIFETFGLRVFELLARGEMDEVASKFTAVTAQKLIEGFRKYENLQHAVFFADMGIPPVVQQKLFKFHKAESVQEIKKNPYCLQHFGCSFKDVDTLAVNKFAVDPYDPRRMNALVESAMQQYCKDGHTVCPIDDLWNLVVDGADGDEYLAEESIVNAHSSLSVYYNENSGLIHSTGLYIMEGVIAKRIQHLLSLKNGWCVGADEAYSKSVAQFEFPLTEKQGEAIIRSLEHHVFTLTGGAGTGKTTVMKAIVDSYTQLGFKVFGVALSGRAAKRLQESILIETQTIQRFLMLKDEDVCEYSSILLVIDEASMVDIPSLYKLIMKLPKHARIIFTGDDQQLPPIGAGLVLSELISSGSVPRVHLDIVRRQSEETGIPVYSNDIRQGVVPKELTYKNVQFITSLKKNIVSEMVDLYMELDGEVQIISPTRKIAKEVNELCQAVANPYGKKLLLVNPQGECEDVGIRLGDPIIFTKNNYREDIQNGTLGTVVGLRDNTDNKILARVEIDTGRIVEVNYDLLDTIELSYAITLHKAQGSQFSTVVAPIFTNRLMDKSWIYTAITRATDKMTFIGCKKSFADAIVSETKASRRNVYLSNLINA
ncbi:hypothetical protein BCU70_21585 [Vibrio sp. 10N.286.49.C2]|uniref:AAA family ATPase n=1 Tax=unclassified Vibrio TaxID=2614977 RepID=UPI000C84220B|nr:MULTISPECIES: AAA family ATPase [unclassified Vibrio]PMH30840.1 hypothetical protein BCU70_21585 [Vibrio sp. 10N.286.49.C2]PMH50890.1 hypothetical protein BCU66_17695 [Vibrio sp. 10N.286.49.B1]PMH78956.1 hypothetical protein BCU58_07215 [Vibrio sp. 10N.286.48.B7]